MFPIDHQVLDLVQRNGVCRETRGQSNPDFDRSG
jgi:hypothetical protein